MEYRKNHFPHSREGLWPSGWQVTLENASFTNCLKKSNPFNA